MNPACKKCRRPTIRFQWYEDPKEDIEYFYCQECDLVQTFPRRWSELERPREVRLMGKEALFILLKNHVKLRGYNVLPYHDCDVKISKAEFPFVYEPCQRYILEDNINHIIGLHEMLLCCYGVDIMKLDGFVRVFYQDQIIDILPPVIEVYFAPNEDEHLIICDGMHRLYACQIMGIVPKVVYISGIPEQWPYYAYPNVRGWDDVQVVQEVPTSSSKKWHRMHNHKDFYRDFNSAFENVGNSRKAES